jgi:hypothetical protein
MPSAPIRGRPVGKRRPTTFRPSDDVYAMLVELQELMGLKQSGVIEVAIRDYYRKTTGRKKPEKPGEKPQE